MDNEKRRETGGRPSPEVVMHRVPEPLQRARTASRTLAGNSRGRPPGSVKFDPSAAQLIIDLIGAGVFDYVAAEAAGTPDRTFRDWMARGEGRHPTRGPTPELAAFAEDVRRAKARARALAETTVFTERPAYWLSRAARSTPGREGWTDPVPEPKEQTSSTCSCPHTTDRDGTPP